MICCVYRQIDRVGCILTDNNMTAANVELQAGYDNLEHFIRTLRKVHGMTPTSYQRKNAKV